MAMSMITVLLFAIGIIGLLLFPKSQGRLNGIKIVVMGTMAMLCYLAFCAAVCSGLGVFVGLKSTCISLVLFDLLLWGGIIYKKRVQRLVWRVPDIVGILLLGAFVIAISMHIFTPDLQLQYRNADAAAHFSYAMAVVHTGHLDSFIYFSAYVDALFIELLAPMLAPVLYFKAFIVADIFMHVLEIWVFYCLVLTISDKRLTRILAPIFSIGYFFGYPAYSYMLGNFVYWSNGVVIFMFSIYALLLVEKHDGLRKYSIPLLALGIYGNLCCNKLFVPTNTLALCAALVIVIIRKQKSDIRKRQMVLGVLGLVAAGIVTAAVIIVLKGETLLEFLDFLLVPGGIYASLYADIIFFLPALFFVVWYAVRTSHYSKTISVISVCMVIITVAMYLMWYNHLMTTYYYYKIYYNLWLCGWMLVVAAFGILQEKRKAAGGFCYLGMVALICWITLSDYDTQIAKTHEEYNGEYATTQMFPLYRYNLDLWQTDYENYRISEKNLEVFRYAMEELRGENIRMLTSDVGAQIWYGSTNWYNLLDTKFQTYKFGKQLSYLDEAGVQAIIVQLDDEIYRTYQPYFDACKWIYGNEDAAILRPTDEVWKSISDADIRAMEKQADGLEEE